MMTGKGPLKINLDDADAAARIATAFVRAGCRRLAFANSQAGTPSLMAREHGFVGRGERPRHGCDRRAVRPYRYESGRVVAQQLLTRKERPDAVFCATDLLACGFMDAARHQFSMSVPDQICVAGFDDIEQASWSSYGLTTFAQARGHDCPRGPCPGSYRRRPSPSTIRCVCMPIWSGAPRSGAVKPYGQCAEEIAEKGRDVSVGTGALYQCAFPRAHPGAVCGALLPRSRR